MDIALSSKERWSSALPVVLVAATIIAADQISKFLIRATLELGESAPSGWAVRITHVENTGSAFGLFNDQTLFLIVASIVAIGVMIYLFRQIAQGSMFLRVLLGMQLGGALSNLADRIVLGKVTDFIDFQVWPVFNVADSSVVIGIILLAWVILFHGKDQQKA